MTEETKETIWTSAMEIRMALTLAWQAGAAHAIGSHKDFIQTQPPMAETISHLLGELRRGNPCVP